MQNSFPNNQINNQEVVKEDLIEIVNALKSQFEFTEGDARQRHETYLRRQFNEGNFFAQVFEILRDMTIPENIKSALIIFIESRLKHGMRTEMFPYNQVKNIFDCFYKFLNIAEIDITLKEKCTKIFYNIATAVCKISFEFECSWDQYFNSIKANIESINWDTINSRDTILQIYASFFILKNFFEGVNDISGEEIKPVYDFLIQYAPRLYQLALKDDRCESKEL